MCLSPNMLDDGTLVACRKCRLCRENTIKDWAGRLVAESKTSQFGYFGLLTYGDDALGDQGKIKAAVLTYSDVQKYFKRLRKRVGKFKYFVVGEYGSTNDRAHWHVVLFTQEPLQMDQSELEEFDPKKNLFIDGYLRLQGEWDLGWSSFSEFHHSQSYYCCKYLYKTDEDDLTVAEHHMSKFPPIGTEYFQQLAEKYVEAGLAPQDLKYTFPEIKDSEGKPREYMLRRKSAENFLEHFVMKWQEKYGQTEMEEGDWWSSKRPSAATGTPIPASPVVDEYLEKRHLKIYERVQFVKDQIFYANEACHVEEEKKREAQGKKAARDAWLHKHSRPGTCVCSACETARKQQEKAKTAFHNPRSDYGRKSPDNRTC